MKKNARNILSAVLVLSLLAVLLIVPATAENAAVVTTAEQLKNAVAAGGEITLGADIDVGTAIEVTTEVVLDLNGKTLSCPDDTEGNGVFHVTSGGKLTINGEGTINSVGKNDYSMAIWADGGEVIINGGTYTNVGCKVEQDPDNNHYDLIYVKNGGSVSIHGGTFICEIPKWTLNSHDSLTGTFEVHGGAFVGFDPANADTEPGGPVNWVAAGSTCTAVGSTYSVTGVAAIGNAQYATLQAAIDAAEDGDTIEILADQTLTAQHVIEKDVTINGNGWELTTSTVQRLIWVKANVTINDLTVTNTYSGGRCIETRVGGITLNLNNVTLNATKGSTQALTVGGNAGTDGDVVVNLDGCHIDAGSIGYGIITFNPVALTIEDSTAVCGYGALYLKPADGSVGSVGSVVEIKGSTLTSNGRDDGYAFGTIIIQDSNITVNVDKDSELIATNPENSTGRQYAVHISGVDKTGAPAFYSGITVNVAGKMASEYLIGNLTSLENAVYIPAEHKEAIEASTEYKYLTTAADDGLIRVWADHDHDLDKTDAVKETCTTDGNKEYYTCEICGKLFADEDGTTELTDVVIPAAHSFGDWMPEKDATCTEPGHKDHFLCAACGLYKVLAGDGETYVDATEKDVIISAPGHKIVHVEAKGATCTDDGNEEYWYCETCSGDKIYADKALTTETALEKVTIPAGHNYTSRVDAKAATCTEDGNVEYWACEYCDVVEIVTESGRVESTQDKVIVKAEGHTATKVNMTAATCTGEGNVEYYHCSVCEKNYSDEACTKELTSVVISAAGHKLVKTEAKDATCTEAGNTEYYTCEHCKKLFTDDKGTAETTAEKTVIAAKAHTEVAVPGKAPTCTESGLTEGKKCSVCATVTVEQEVIAALGHKLTKVEAKPATYTEAGNIEHYACACGKLFADAEGKNEITDVVIPQLIKVEEEKAEVSKDAVDNAIADAKDKAEETGKPVEVVIEVPKAPVVEKPEDPEGDGDATQPEEKPQEVVKVELPVDALENVAKEEATLTVVMPSVTVTVDTDALKTVTEQAAGNTVTLVVEQVKEETLTEKQQEVIKKYDVAVTIKAEFICQETNEKIWTEDNNAEKNSGSVTVKMPFTPAEGSEGSDYTVLYIADDGTVKVIETAFEDGHLVFSLEHFSEYVVVNTSSTDIAPDTSDKSLVAPFALLVALSFTGLVLMTVGKKQLI